MKKGKFNEKQRWEIEFKLFLPFKKHAHVLIWNRKQGISS